MPDPNLIRLQNSAENLTEGKNLEERVSQLTEAFSLFSEETQRLERAYKDLQKRFSDVNAQLKDTNTRLQEKVLELDITTQYLNSILSNITQGIVFVGTTGLVTTYNVAAERILEKNRYDVLFNPFESNFDNSFFDFSMEDALEQLKAPEQGHLHYTSPSGQQKELSISTSFVISDDDSMTGIIVLIRDITEVRLLQIAANRNDRLKELGEMAASVAHEIRNPLGGIEGFASLLVRDLQEEPQLCNMAQNIVEGTRVLNRMVTNVLHYARPLKMRFRPSNLVALIQDLCKIQEADPNYSERIRLEIQCDFTQLILPVDPDMLKSALLNLLINAADSMEEGGTVHIQIAMEEDQALVTISDKGDGISPEHIEKIFSPFFTTKQEGTGLGLSEVHKIIQAHNGSIHVSSVPGEGSQFTVALPLLRATK